MNPPLDEMLKQRPPFQFVERYAPRESDDEIETFFTFTGDEDFFKGHFPGDPVVPGVLLIEAMAQTARVALARKYGARKAGYLARVVTATFNKPVRPPQEVRFIARLQPVSEENPQYIQANCSAFMGRSRSARAEITLSINED